MSTLLGDPNNSRDSAFLAAMTSAAGPPVDVFRLYAQANDTWGGSLFNSVVAAAGSKRVPIVSTKLATSWSAIAGGSTAEWTRLDAIASGLAGIDKSKLPVGVRPFFTVHHEPEGDGTPSDYNGMYQKLLARYRTTLENAGWDFGVIAMGGTFLGQTKWTLSQLQTALNGLALKAVFADIYVWRGADASGSNPWATKDAPDPNDPASPFAAYLNWAEGFGYRTALAEFGVSRRQSDTTGTERTAYLDAFARSTLRDRFEFVVYYNKDVADGGKVNWAIDQEPASMAAFGRSYVSPVDLAAEVASLSAQVTELQADLASCESDLDATRTTLAATQSALDAANAQVTSLTTRVLAANEKLGSIAALATQS